MNSIGLLCFAFWYVFAPATANAVSAVRLASYAIKPDLLRAKSEMLKGDFSL
jgi:hypothetical protein